VWVKIGKVAVVILVLIALFFISMKVTEIVLDRNSEPEYSSDAPAYNDYETEDNDEDIPGIREQEDESTEYKEYEEQDKTSVKPVDEKKPDDEKKPEETQKPAEKPTETQKPAETPKPAEKPQETQKPSTEPAPSKPSKPVIVPGNPAA
jgi:outer membrane biosynthesis protein TonB